jgi:succinoglycan biosynthesis protein ExoM
MARTMSCGSHFAGNVQAFEASPRRIDTYKWRQAMTKQSNHISICICTYKRPTFLQHLLTELVNQETGGRFTYSIVVSDNDRLCSAEPLVSEFAATSNIDVKYCVEPQQSIALARNKAVQNATGDYIAFIDDDEFPVRHWLRTLFAACEKYGVDGVLGPVKPLFGEGVPRWIVKGRFYDRPCYETGFVLAHGQTRTGNVLLREHVLRETNSAFRPEFRAGEDVDFFRRAMEQGSVFIWCNEAVVYEAVPPPRWKRMYLLRKALLRGACAALRPTIGVLDVTKSVVAVPIYGLALPLAALVGQHRFMVLLVRLCDHLGKLLALLGMNPIAEPYITG